MRKHAQLTPLAPGIDRIDGFFPPGVTAIQTSRLGGQSVAPFDRLNLASHVGDDPLAVKANRARLNQVLPQPVQWLNQVHGADVLELPLAGALVTEADHCGLSSDTAQIPPQADAAYSSQPGQVCAVMTADCLPVLIARGDGAVVGSAHAGWRGLCAGVIESTVRQMWAAKPNDEPNEWFFWLGPAIGQAAFEVGPEVRQAFWDQAHSDVDRQQLATSQAFLPGAQPGKWLASLSELAQLRIERICRELDISKAYIAIEPCCVWSDPARYFSFRRDRTTGRMASLIYRNA